MRPAPIITILRLSCGKAISGFGYSTLFEMNKPAAGPKESVNASGSFSLFISN